MAKHFAFQGAWHLRVWHIVLRCMAPARQASSSHTKSVRTSSSFQLVDIDLGVIPFDEGRTIQLSLAGDLELLREVRFWESSCHCVSVQTRSAVGEIRDTTQLTVGLHPSETPVDGQFCVEIKGLSDSKSVLTRFSVTFRQANADRQLRQML